MHHAGDVVLATARDEAVDSVPADDGLLAVFWHGAWLSVDVDAADPQAAIVRRTSDAVRLLEDNHCDFPALVNDLPRPTRHVLLEPDRVPHSHCPVRRASREKGMVRRNCNPSDARSVLN